MSYVDRQPLHCPKKGASAEELDKFLNRVIDPLSSKRIELEDEWLLSKAYLEGHQWLNKVKNSGSTRDYRRAPRVRDSSRNEIPTPTDNIILEAVENEVARLSKRNSELYVEPSDASPAAKAGAKKATDVLMDHLSKIRWERIRYRFNWRNVEYGTAILKSYLQQDNLDTVKVGVTGAMRCQPVLTPPSPEEVAIAEMQGQPQPPAQMKSCGLTLASQDMTHEHVSKLSPEMRMTLGGSDEFDVPGMPEEENAKKRKYKAEACPDCNGPLEPFMPTGDELNQTDMVGRPLGKDIPLGSAMIECKNVFEVYFSNDGLGQEPENITEIAECTPRHLDWVKRYYRKNVDQVKAEDPTEIAETHPLWCEYGASSRGATGVAETRYQNHVRVREFHKWPSVDYPRGRSIVMAGNVVLMDDDLMVDSPKIEGVTEEPKPFPRVKYAVARCFPKDGEIHGQGFPAHAISDQNRINMTLSQIVDTRERHGVAGVMATRGMKLTSPGWIKGFSGRVLYWEPDPAKIDAEPKMLDTQLMNPGVYKELEHSIARAAQRLGTNEVEIGNAPAGVKAYSAIAYLGEKASERRQQREKEIISCYEEVFEHQLMLMQRYYREPRAYHVKTGEDRERREFVGLDLQGETRAKVKEQPSFDLKTAEREALAENIQNFPELLATPYARREVAKTLGIPIAAMDQTNVQLDAANRKWFDFLREGKIPRVDETLDNHQIHFDEYGRLLLSDEGVEMAVSAGFDEADKILYGWKARLFPTQQAPPMPTAPGEPPGPPVTIPAMSEIPPGPLQDRIMQLWGIMLGEQGAMPTPDLMQYLAIRSVLESHHILAEQAMGGAPMPAPGTMGSGPMGDAAAAGMTPPIAEGVAA